MMKVGRKISIILIVIISIGNILIEYLTNLEYTSSVIMFWNSGISFLFMLGFSIFIKKEKPVINNKKILIFRIFLNGLGMYLVIESFNYLAAGTVAMIQRIDIAILIIISSFVQRDKSSLQFYMSIWVIILVSFFIINANFIDEDILGFPYVLGGVIVATIGYLIMKKQTSIESNHSLGVYYSLGLMIWGGVFTYSTSQSFNINLIHIPLFILGGLVQFGIVKLILQLYKHFDVELARIPFVLAVIVTFILEMVIEQKMFSINQLLISILITGMICTICLNPKVPLRGKLSNTKKSTL